VRLHVLSDLHLEQAPFELGENGNLGDVVVLAGDIARGTGGVEWARRWAREHRAARRRILYVAGNHEFYGHELPGLIDDLHRAAEGSSVNVLENEQVVVDGIRFLGCTLWSDFDFAGADHREQSMLLCRRVVNDYKHIRFGPDGRALAPHDTRRCHVASRRWLAARLDESFDGPTVVITHHAPLIRSQPPTPLLRLIAGAFASDVTELMGADRVALWIFGHTHRFADLTVRGTRVISNPRGYPRQPVGGFDPAFVVEVDA
jgi:predicted phosphodiesterase